MQGIQWTSYSWRGGRLLHEGLIKHLHEWVDGLSVVIRHISSPLPWTYPDTILHTWPLDLDSNTYEAHHNITIRHGDRT